MYNPRFTGIHSSPKERQSQKSVCFYSFFAAYSLSQIELYSHFIHNYSVVTQGIGNFLITLYIDWVILILVTAQFNVPHCSHSHKLEWDILEH